MTQTSPERGFGVRCHRETEAAAQYVVQLLGRLDRPLRCTFGQAQVEKARSGIIVDEVEHQM